MKRLDQIPVEAAPLHGGSDDRATIARIILLERRWFGLNPILLKIEFNVVIYTCHAVENGDTDKLRAHSLTDNTTKNKQTQRIGPPSSLELSSLAATQRAFDGCEDTCIARHLVFAF
ncbi:hypothetical protein L596_012807 [Steinernema carpocapsae]|uniref:Uncharacterized protein n=1 Tax=Steinernema carpocapsae TaxID=34508 RepID=A0A4U5NYU2_STECR|nr:hypothetical protein L596_012807 [Steinernema carpocapsae]